MSVSQIKREKVMTEKAPEAQVKEAAPAQTSLQEEQIQLVRASLIQAIFEKYHALVGMLRKLPLPPELPGIQQGYLSIDTGMLWFKELLNTAPLILAPVPPATTAKQEEVKNEVEVEAEKTEESSQEEIKKSA